MLYYVFSLTFLFFSCAYTANQQEFHTPTSRRSLVPATLPNFESPSFESPSSILPTSHATASVLSESISNHAVRPQFSPQRISLGRTPPPANPEDYLNPAASTATGRPSWNSKSIIESPEEKTPSPHKPYFGCDVINLNSPDSPPFPVISYDTALKHFHEAKEKNPEAIQYAQVRRPFMPDESPSPKRRCISSEQKEPQNSPSVPSCVAPIDSTRESAGSMASSGKKKTTHVPRLLRFTSPPTSLPAQSSEPSNVAALFPSPPTSSTSTQSARPTQPARPAQQAQPTIAASIQDYRPANPYYNETPHRAWLFESLDKADTLIEQKNIECDKSIRDNKLKIRLLKMPKLNGDHNRSMGIASIPLLLRSHEGELENLEEYKQKRIEQKQALNDIRKEMKRDREYTPCLSTALIQVPELPHEEALNTLKRKRR